MIITCESILGLFSLERRRGDIIIVFIQDEKMLQRRITIYYPAHLPPATADHLAE